jgi:uncharacterized repeat protein (TIGR01451 family)
MNRFAKLAALTAISAVVFPSVAMAAGTGQIEQGNIYRAKDLTTNSAFATTITGACGDTVAFRVRIHNTGPSTLTNVKAAATLNAASGTSHGSQISLSADNNLNNMVVTASSGVNTSSATTADYISGSTQLLGYSPTPGNEPVLRSLPDGILGGGVNIGSVGPLTPDTEEVQFQVKLNCASTPPPPPTPTPTPTPAAKALPNTGAGDVIGIFTGASSLGAAGHFLVNRRRG